MSKERKKAMTRKELENVLSVSVMTKTLHNREDQKKDEIDETWVVRWISSDEKGVLKIYCDKPE